MNILMTAKIGEKVPQNVLKFLLECVDQLPNNKDYLQVFDLDTDSEGILHVVHTQEEPEYREEYSIPLNEVTLKGKIFIIIEKVALTIMWSHEY